MSKGKYIVLCAVALVSAAALTGCGGKNLPAGEPAGGEESSAKESPVKIAKLPADKRFDLVMYSEGCYCIFDGSYYGFMTEEGEEITPYIYEQAAPFSEGLACVFLDGKYGFIGKDGETELPFIYDQASSFTEGLAYFCIGEDYGFIDHEGNVVLKPNCDSISSFQEGRAYFSVDGLYGYLDKTGRIIVEPIYEDAGYFWDGLAMVMRNGSYGVIGIEGEEILPPEYDYIDWEEDFIIADKDGLEYCFDRDGRKCLEEGWDSIEKWEGVFLVEHNGRSGLLDSDGKVLLEPKYDSLVPIPEKELVIAESDGLYGVIDYAGKEKVPCVYSSISYDASGAGGLYVMCEETYKEEKVTYCSRSYGFLSFTEEGSFEEISPVYDYMSSFVGDRAVVETQGKYGIIRRDGSLEYPVEYDSIKLYKNGSLALWTGNTAELIDSDGNVFHSGEYDYITLSGRGYSVEKDRNYDHSVNDLLVKEDEGEETGLPGMFLQNHITPRVKEYMDFLQNSVINDENDYIFCLSELGQASRKFSKLYRVDGELVLYFYECPYVQTNVGPLSNSGFFVFRDGKMVQLAAGYECGGTALGDYICFWYDKAESRIKLGVYGCRGGFIGFSHGGTVYELQSEGAEVTASWICIDQASDNYEQAELLENAELFYDNDNCPYTGETILDSGAVTEYKVNGERTTIECYEEICDRYRYMGALDLNWR